MADRITHVSTRLFLIPLSEILTDAKHGEHHHFEPVTTTIGLASGDQGTGYTYTGGKAAERFRP